LCKKSGTIVQVLLGFTAGWLFGRLALWQAGWLADKIVLNLEIFKIIYIPDETLDFLLCLTKVWCYYCIL